jgi:aryl sulfotransferase
LIFNGAEGVANDDISVWVDVRHPPREVKHAKLEAQTHRRFIKTHLPVDALVFSPKAKYLYVARDGRDVAWSLHNMQLSATEDWLKLCNEAPYRVDPPIGPACEDVY